MVPYDYKKPYCSPVIDEFKGYARKGAFPQPTAKEFKDIMKCLELYESLF